MQFLGQIRVVVFEVVFNVVFVVFGVVDTTVAFGVQFVKVQFDPVQFFCEQLVVPQKGLEPHVVLHQVLVQLVPVQLTLEQLVVQFVGHWFVLVEFDVEFDGQIELVQLVPLTPVQLIIVQF